MDFARIDPRRDAESGGTWHVEYDGRPLYMGDDPIEIDFLGPQSQVGKRAGVELAKAIERTLGNKGVNLKKMSVEEVLEKTDRNDINRARFYAKLTTGWRHVQYIEDEDLEDPKAVAKDLPFTYENAVKLYSTRAWIMDGIDPFLSDAGNFMRRDKTS